MQFPIAETTILKWYQQHRLELRDLPNSLMKLSAPEKYGGSAARTAIEIPCELSQAKAVAGGDFAQIQQFVGSTFR